MAQSIVWKRSHKSSRLASAKEHLAQKCLKNHKSIFHKLGANYLTLVFRKGFFSMENAQKKMTLQHYQLVNKQVAAEMTGLSSETLKKYRLEGILQKDIHWVVINSRVIRYNISLVLDWMQNKDSNPQGHLRAIESYLASLPSGQKKPRANHSRRYK